MRLHLRFVSGLRHFNNMEQTILEYGKLTDTQKLEAVDLFLEGFGHFLTFSKDEELKKKLLFEIFDPALFKCCLEGEKVLHQAKKAIHV